MIVALFPCLTIILIFICLLAATGQPVIVTAVVPVGPDTTRMVCPSCHFEIDTVIRKDPGLIAWISGSVLLLFG